VRGILYRMVAWSRLLIVVGLTAFAGSASGFDLFTCRDVYGHAIYSRSLEGLSSPKDLCFREICVEKDDGTRTCTPIHVTAEQEEKYEAVQDRRDECIREIQAQQKPIGPPFDPDTELVMLFNRDLPLPCDPDASSAINVMSPF
jgi:hypothetical protein